MLITLHVLMGNLKMQMVYVTIVWKVALNAQMTLPVISVMINTHGHITNTIALMYAWPLVLVEQMGAIHATLVILEQIDVTHA